MIENVNSYLYSNDRDKIPSIINQFKKFPDLENEMKNIEKGTTVYRGVNIHDTELAKEREQDVKYVATSLFESVAENFAKAKGHLDKERGNETGVMLVYSINPESIVLDTNIFGSVYGEREILIDRTKSKLIRSYTV